MPALDRGWLKRGCFSVIVGMFKPAFADFPILGTLLKPYGAVLLKFCVLLTLVLTPSALCILICMWSWSTAAELTLAGCLMWAVSSPVIFAGSNGVYFFIYI